MASRIYERVMAAISFSVSAAVAVTVAVCVDVVAVAVDIAAVVADVDVDVEVVDAVDVVGTSVGRSMRSISVRQPRRLCK